METDETTEQPSLGTTTEPAANDTPEETAFFAAMDEIVERVTGPRPDPEQIRGCEADDQGPEDPGF